MALACASRLILDCLDRNIYPRWDAANKESVALADSEEIWEYVQSIVKDAVVKGYLKP